MKQKYEKTLEQKLEDVERYKSDWIIVATIIQTDKDNNIVKRYKQVVDYCLTPEEFDYRSRSIKNTRQSVLESYKGDPVYGEHYRTAYPLLGWYKETNETVKEKITSLELFNKKDYYK